MLPFRDLIVLAREQAGLIDFPLMDDRYQFNKRRTFSDDFDESGSEEGDRRVKWRGRRCRMVQWWSSGGEGYVDEFSGEEGDVD